MGIHHGRLYVAMAEMLLDRADIVAPSSGFVAEEWQLRVIRVIWTKNLDGRSTSGSRLTYHSTVSLQLG